MVIASQRDFVTPHPSVSNIVENLRRAEDRFYSAPGSQFQFACERRFTAHRSQCRRCFPWSGPTRFVSLLDDEKNEFALVPDVRALEPNSREAVEQALAEAGFVLQIERIESVDEEVEIRTWVVRTRQGPRSFQTRLDDWPREVPGGGYVIRDVAGDLYHVADVQELDARSRELLWAYVE